MGEVRQPEKKGRRIVAAVRPSRQRIPTAWSRAMRYISVNQAEQATSGHHAAVLGNGVAQQDTKRAIGSLFYWRRAHVPCAPKIPLYHLVGVLSREKLHKF